MAPERKTWLQRKVEWLENHKVAGPIMLVTICLGVIGGIISFGENSISLFKAIFKEDSELRLTLEVQNTTSNPIEIDPVCRFEIIETGVNFTEFHFGLGDKLRMLPTGSISGTDAYRLKAGESRDYRVHLPNNQSSRDLMERGAATVKFIVAPKAGNAGEGSVSFQRDSMRREKAVVKIKP